MRNRNLLIGTALSLSVLTATAAERPNVVILLADDLGYSDLGCYGGEISTPNLDKLAQQGVRVTQFINSSKSAPSRASLLTGLTSLELGNDGPPIQMVNSLTIAELLARDSDYNRLLSGKWHAKETPTNRGFSHYYGVESGATNYFKLTEKTRLTKDGVKLDGTPENFYTTEFYTDRAIDYINEYAKEDAPYFLMVTYNAPHYPLQAEQKDVAKYRGKYMVGWDKIREERFARQKEMGIVTPSTKLSQRDRAVPAWEDYANKDAADLTMATYASMVERLDENIGRLVETIERTGEADNTLIIFLSDNGGCDEGAMWDGVDQSKRPGTRTSQARLGVEWANACNTPYKAFKRDVLNGGQCTPFIARWDNEIKDRGAIYHKEAHIVDLFPTIMDVAALRHPVGETWHVPSAEGVKGLRSEWQIAPLAGVSIIPMLTKNRDLKRDKPLAGYFQGNYFIRKDGWKLVTNWQDNPKSRNTPQWYLYDIKNDPSETTDLAASNPEKAAELRRDFDAWFKEANALGQIFDENGVKIVGAPKKKKK